MTGNAGPVNHSVNRDSHVKKDYTVTLDDGQITLSSSLKKKKSSSRLSGRKTGEGDASKSIHSKVMETLQDKHASDHGDLIKTNRNVDHEIKKELQKKKGASPEQEIMKVKMGLSAKSVDDPASVAALAAREDFVGKSRRAAGLRPSGATCAKKGASGRMQRPSELVPIPECCVK